MTQGLAMGSQVAAQAPYAGIKNLKFRGVDEVFTPVSNDELSEFFVDTDEGRRLDQQRAIAAGFVPNAVAVGGSEYGGEIFAWGRPTGQFRSWAPDWDALAQLGFQSKYNRSDDITSQLSEAQREALGVDRIFKTTLQQPGKHKYDTEEAFYRVNPQGEAVLIGTPTASRQQSSSKQFRDTLFKEMLPAAAGVATLAGGLPGLSSATFGGGLLGTAGVGAANSAIGTLLRGGGLEDILKGAVTGGITGLVMPTISSSISDIIPGEGVGSLFGRAATDVTQADAGIKTLGTLPGLAPAMAPLEPVSQFSALPSVPFSLPSLSPLTGAGAAADAGIKTLGTLPGLAPAMASLEPVSQFSALPSVPFSLPSLSPLLSLSMVSPSSPVDQSAAESERLLRQQSQGPGGGLGNMTPGGPTLPSINTNNPAWLDDLVQAGGKVTDWVKTNPGLARGLFTLLGGGLGAGGGLSLGGGGAGSSPAGPAKQWATPIQPAAYTAPQLWNPETPVGAMSMGAGRYIGGK